MHIYFADKRNAISGKFYMAAFFSLPRLQYISLITFLLITAPSFYATLYVAPFLARAPEY